MKYRILLSLAPRGVLGRLATLAVWVVGGGILLASVFVASFFLAMRIEMRSTQVQVPDLVGSTLEQAERRAEPMKMKLEVVDRRHDPGVASGRVLEQMPPAGAAVRRGRKVKLVLSLGGKVLEVPDVVGHAARAVAIELRQEGFVPGEEAHVPSNAAAAGQVMAQVPPPRTTALPGSRVHRLVSDGPPPPIWVMPDITGLPRDEAERWISSSGFRRGIVRRVAAAGRPRGSVVGQTPLAGHPIRSKDIVELAVAE